ncbi:O-antigen ligase family protein [Flavobacterium undicola]|uniref:O-antigen ligase family protein n=1 Tax=Flavobacterium undicola TaxID=1932779 RepID=UPI0015E1E275|nr:O-antigen ligase family protein [Flavobacterium undicola]MBA0883953.1 O-antigen ligase family protein [Flavobacterium undicola]
MELLGLSFLYVVLRNIAAKNYYWLLLSVIISGIMQAVYGNLQLLGYYPSNHSGFKMTGSFFNPGPYAGFLISVWAVALGMYLFKDSITTQVQSQTKNNTPFFNEFIKYTFEYIPLLGLISIAIVLPALQSRASWIAVLVSSVVVVELRYHFLGRLFEKVTAKLQKTALILLAIGIISTGLISIYHYKKASSDGRAFIWKVTTEMIADAPVFGVGFDLFKTHYMEYQAQYFQKNGETSEAIVADNTYYAFNEGLQFVAENGLLGLLFLMIVVYVISKTKVKEGHQLNSFKAKTGLLTIGVFACFSYPMQILPIKLVLVVLLAMLSNSTADTFQLKILTPSPSLRERGTSRTIVNSVLYKLTIVLLACAGIYQIFTYTKDLSQGFITWNNALISYQYGDYKGAVLDFELAYPIFKKDGDFLMNYGKTLAMAGEPHKAIVVLEQAKHYQNNTVIATALGDSYKVTKQYDKAEANYQQAINMTPGKFYANYLLAKLYDDSGQEYKAVAMAKKLMNKEIKIPSTAIKEIQGEMKNILAKYKNPPGF